VFGNKRVAGVFQCKMRGNVHVEKVLLQRVVRNHRAPGRTGDETVQEPAFTTPRMSNKAQACVGEASASKRDNGRQGGGCAAAIAALASSRSTAACGASGRGAECCVERVRAGGAAREPNGTL